MKEEFLDFLKALMDAAPEIVEEKMTLGVKSYINILMNSAKDDEALTELGQQVMNYFKNNIDSPVTAKILGDNLGYTPKTFNGVLKKLVDIKYIEKFGKDPVIYCLTTKGKNYINSI